MTKSTRLSQIIEISEGIKGAHSPVSTAIFVYLASLLPSASYALEIGVWNGKSASVLAHLFEKLDLVDVATPSELSLIQSLGTSDVAFHKEWSNEWIQQVKDSRSMAYDFIHMDTSHSFKDTVAELSGCSLLARDHAILVLDDWNEIYPTVQAGYYYYKYVLQGEYEVFLASYNKAYLCKRSFFNRYASRLDELRKFLADQGYNTHIARTSDVDEYRAFLIRPVTQGVEEYYGGKDSAFYRVLRERDIG